MEMQYKLLPPTKNTYLIIVLVYWKIPYSGYCRFHTNLYIEPIDDVQQIIFILSEECAESCHLELHKIVFCQGETRLLEDECDSSCKSLEIWL